MEVPRVLLYRLAGSDGSTAWTALQQLQRRAVKSDEGGRIQGVGEVHSNWAHWCFVADSKTHILYSVVEVLQTALVIAEGYVPEIRVHVAEIVKQDSLNVMAD